MAGNVRLFPRIFGGPRLEKEPAQGWDKETEAITAIGQWLSTVETQEAKLRCLAYWMWRLKSNDDPAKIRDWVDATAETSAEIVGGKVGFGETKRD